MALPLAAADVTVEKVHLEPQSVNEDPQDYLKITIDRREFRASPPGDWRPLDNYAGMDLAFVPPDSRPAFVGLKVERCVDPKGKVYSHFTPELLAAWVKRLKPESARHEGDDPVLSEPVRQVDFTFTRIEENQVWKCRCQLRLVGDRVWILVCEAGPRFYDEAVQKFGVLAGTLVRVEGK